MTRPGIEPWSPVPVANTLLIRPMAGNKGTNNMFKMLYKDFTKLRLVKLLAHFFVENDLLTWKTMYCLYCDDRLLLKEIMSDKLIESVRS